MSLLSLINRMRPACNSILAKYITSKQQFQTVEGGETKKRKTTPVPKITLITGDQVAVSTLLEAQKLAKRRDLKLVKIVDVDTKTQRPIYKLMTGSEFHAEDLKQREIRKAERENSTALKGEKVLFVNCKITAHDLEVHCNKIAKWLAKRYEVKIVINGDPSNMTKAENVFAQIEKQLNELCAHQILQKRQKGSQVQFQVVPKTDQTDLSEPNSL